MIFIVQNSSILASLDCLDLLAMTISSLGHDIAHPAVTNRYLINTKSPLALEYNDLSVLESMHCSLTFKLMTNFNCDILSNLSNDDWIYARNLIIQMILNTDMSKHFENLGKFRTRAVALSDLDLRSSDDKAILLVMALKCADLGYTAKDTDLNIKWSKLASEELFKQGDLEKEQGLSISMYCDRDATDVNKSNIGMIINICLPMFDVLGDYLSSSTFNESILAQIKINLNYWEGKYKIRERTMLPNISDNKTKKPKIVRRQSGK